jgi:hypothetical protein
MSNQKYNIQSRMDLKERVRERIKTYNLNVAYWKSARLFNIRSLINEIKELVKIYINQTNDKDIESFQIERKDGRYKLNDK